MMNVQYNNYKTQLCKFWVQEGKCKFNKNCSYAHGEEELRRPYDDLPKDAIISSNNGVKNDALGLSQGKNMPLNNYDNRSPQKTRPNEINMTQSGIGPSNLKIVINNYDEQTCSKILKANELI